MLLWDAALSLPRAQGGGIKTMSSRVRVTAFEDLRLALLRHWNLEESLK